MAKDAQSVAEKYASRAAMASGDYVKGVESTDKDQNARAIASAEIHKQATMESLQRGDYAKGLRAAGLSKYQEGVRKKGQGRFSEGVSGASADYANNSAKYDTARRAADSLPRGPKGSAANLKRVEAVVTAQRKAKVGA